MALWSQRHPDEARCRAKHSSYSDPKRFGIAHLTSPRVGPLLLSVYSFLKGLSFVPTPGITRTEDARSRSFGVVMSRLEVEALCKLRREQASLGRGV